MREMLCWVDDGSINLTPPRKNQPNQYIPSPKIPRSEWPDLLARVAEGKESTVAIAKSYGVSERTVRRTVKAARLAMLVDEQATSRDASSATNTPQMRPRRATRASRRNVSRAARFATGGRAHVARPTMDAGTACWHTEAIHKANLTADRVQTPALGSFDVGNATGLVAGAGAVDPHRRRLHVLALDADHRGSKEEVALARQLQEQGYPVALARWDGVRAMDPMMRWWRARR